MLEGIGAIAIKGDELAVRVFLAGDFHLLGDEVVHGHLATERACRVEGGAGDGALAVVGEVDDGAMGEIEGRERSVGICHVGESGDVVMGLGQEEVLVGGDGLVLERDSELSLD